MPPESPQKETIAVIGLGKTGTAIGHLLRRAGYPIVAVTGRTRTPPVSRIAYTGGTAFAADANAEAAALATCIFITTPDDAIATVCRGIAENGGIRPGDKVIHTSGACGLDLLAPARAKGARVASIHPLQSFADVEGAIRNIPGSTFGVTAEEDLREWSLGIVRELGGTPVEVPEAARPLYHAAACLASNYLTTLIHTVEEIYLALGLGRDEARRAFWPLVRGTLSNIEARGTVQALTGPIARGDAGTIARHLDVLRETAPGCLPVYRALGLLTVELASKRGTLSPEELAGIRTHLEGG